MILQNTIASAFTLSGIGIHSGRQGRVTVHPAEENTGRVFRAGGIEIPAHYNYVADTRRCTTLGHEGTTISTVEHLLSALYGMQIDNAVIEVEGIEIPILDGSALPFVEAIQSVGIAAQTASANVMTLSKEIHVRGTSEMHVLPSETFSIRCAVAFENWTEGTANPLCEVESPAVYANEIAPARTFAFQHEVEALLAAGLAKGGSLDNALIITPPNTFSTPLRMPQEWAIHKILDIIGDLALIDARLCLTLEAVKPGHRINTELAGILLEHGQVERKG